ncbi:flippase-like domain-containing protein [candidate division KSB1 bacterium]|nr:flippase-like domain-containing protein [candidate division KSB1 bacterium]
MFFLLYSIGFNKILNQLIHMDLTWFIIGLAIFTLSNFLGSWQWYLILGSSNLKISFDRVLAFYYSGLFFNNFLIGYIGGDAIRIYDVNKNTKKMAESISSVILDRFIGFATLTSMALFGSLIWINNSVSIKLLPIILVILTGWLVLIFLLFDRRIINRYKHTIKKIIPHTITSRLAKIYIALHSFRDHKTTILKIILISIATQLLRILVHYTAARAIGVEIHFIYFLIFVPIIALLSSLPVSIGGIGVRETSGVALFSQVWSAESDIVAFEFIAYILGIVSTLPGGLIFMFRKEYKEHIKTGDILQ